MANTGNGKRERERGGERWGGVLTLKDIEKIINIGHYENRLSVPTTYL